MSIELQHVHFRYPDGTLANEDLNLVIHEGERIAIVGQNGAGKTTAVKLMNGLHKPTEGEVIINGINTRNKSTAQISGMVGYVFQNPDDQIFKNTVRDEVEFWSRYNKLDEKEIQSRAEWAAKLCDIEKYLDINPYEIPYSTKKFVSIAAVLTARNPYLILDEPTAGQDVAGVECLSKLLHYMEQDGKSVITITHDMEFVADNFKRVVVMAHGHIIADGTPAEIFAEESILSEAKIKKPQICELSTRLGLGNIMKIETLVNKL
ncbi:MAG: energy-coupling factor ABC transporter ATP-binding protein [Lachnospiraceae bacterium]|nr:energy-coupling factor ABC transporter ATP-binding protein [Lachnospiraceae bacterium]